MLDKILLERLMPVTAEEQDIINRGKIDRGLYMAGCTDIVSSKYMLEKGKLISVRKHPRFAYFPEHTHNYIEVVYMCSGSMCHTINGKEIILSEGELLFLSRNTAHAIKETGIDDIAVNFIILPAFFDSSCSIIGGEETPLKRFVAEWLCADGGPDYMHFKVAENLPVQNLVENLIWTLLNDTQNKRIINRTTMELLFMHLLGCTDTLEYSEASDVEMMKVMSYIEDNYKSGSLSEIAERLHFDTARLSREIKRRTGSNYTDLVQEKRLSQAALYLKNTQMKINDISVSVGYDNVSYFYRLFKEHFGMSPKLFRSANKDIN